MICSQNFQTNIYGHADNLLVYTIQMQYVFDLSFILLSYSKSEKLKYQFVTSGYCFLDKKHMSPLLNVDLFE